VKKPPFTSKNLLNHTYLRQVPCLEFSYQIGNAKVIDDAFDIINGYCPLDLKIAFDDLKFLEYVL